MGGVWKGHPKYRIEAAGRDSIRSFRVVSTFGCGWMCVLFTVHVGGGGTDFPVMVEFGMDAVTLHISTTPTNTTKNPYYYYYILVMLSKTLYNEKDNIALLL
jgi:hypothetical protein